MLFVAGLQVRDEPTALQRIRALEHAENWTAALQEYEQVLQEPAAAGVGGRTSLSGQGGGGGGGEGAGGWSGDDGDNDDAEFEIWESSEEGTLEHGSCDSCLFFALLMCPVS